MIPSEGAGPDFPICTTNWLRNKAIAAHNALEFLRILVRRLLVIRDALTNIRGVRPKRAIEVT